MRWAGGCSMTNNVVVTLARDGQTAQVEGARVCFSVHRCFAVDDGETRALLRRLADYLLRQPDLALWDGPLLGSLFQVSPALRDHVSAVIARQTAPVGGRICGVAACGADALPQGLQTVFLCQTRAIERMTSRQCLPGGLTVISAEILSEIAIEAIPSRAWTPIVKNIYPIKLPTIRFSGHSALILLDCPARNLALMPNGLGYVHNALKRSGIVFETFDLDIVTYHHYHIGRLFDEGGTIVLPSGREMPTDPWQAENYDLWTDPEVLAYLSPIISQAADAIVDAKPKILGLSIQQCNEGFSKLLVDRVKSALPDVVILVGGFSCYNADIGLKAFPQADYMCIGEADLTVGPLAKRLVSGERPKDLPGVLSRYDTPDRIFVPAPLSHNLDRLDFPRYEWFDIDIYRNFNGYQLVPIIASRGCRWSRCTFCAERFYWRIRSARNFVDELAWLADQGCTLFMFNESDLNGMPEKLVEICDEIIRRDIKVRLTGQLRIQKTSDRPFYDRLRAAGFVALRFGVDAFSANTLRLQKKGYTVEMIRQNLRDCWEAGIFTEVNWVIGVPGETDADCQEGIELILENQKYIGRLANILVNGSVYWIDPERHGIRFRIPKEELYAANPRYVPAESWFSVDPYIDAQVRKVRFERIVMRLYDAGFKVGPWAERVIADVKLSRDRARAGEICNAEAAYMTQEPAVCRVLSTHRIVRSRNRYYALPHALGEVDLTRLESANLEGILSADSETDVLIEIEHGKRWANSRGQYDAQERQKIAGSLYRAASAIGSERPLAEIARPSRVVRLNGEYFAVRLEDLNGLTWRQNGAGIDERIVSQSAAVPGTDIAVVRATSKGAQPVLLTSIARYNVVEYDGLFFGIPQGLPFDWHDPNSILQPGVIAAGNVADLLRSIPDCRQVQNGAQAGAAVERGSGPAGEAIHLPMLIGAVEEYNLVSYEGFVYGIPQSLGEIDLTEVDVIAVHGVIRDVSRQAVENEINDLVATRRQAAE
jgi:radical SAM superfamily enzyme YgiQ (UPF0313 family)